MHRFRYLIPFLILLISGILFFIQIPKNSFFSLPVIFEGRLQPYDSVARNTLLFISEKQNPSTFTYKEIFMSLISHQADIDTKNIFLIRDSQILDYLSLKHRKKHLYPFSDILPHQDKIHEFASLIEQINSGKRSSFQRNILKLKNKIDRYLGLKYSFYLPRHIPLNYSLSSFYDTHQSINHLISHNHDLKNIDNETLISLKNHAMALSFFEQMKNNSLLYMYPSKTDNKIWFNNGDLFLSSSLSKEYLVLSEKYYSLIGNKNEHNNKNKILELNNFVSSLSNSSSFKVKLEFYYNHYQPFYVALCIYMFLFLFSFYFIFKSSKTSFQIFKYLFYSNFILHTGAILARILLISRPPVTNLYSSAIFVSWIAILAFIILYCLFNYKILFTLSSVIGFVSLIIAHQLSIGADTLENMRAVLDSNFWLSTHVVTMCMGYGAVYVASILGCAYILIGYFSTKLTSNFAHKLFQMTYGFVCIGLLFSVVGTLLGGIWGDQSWGRFWGWDPKENGAILIVLWLAIMLHARLAGMCKVKGFMSLAVLSGIVTSFSWFGVNLMGIGLHSYGFIAEGFVWLSIYSIIMLYISCLIFIPNKYWQSFNK